MMAGRDRGLIRDIYRRIANNRDFGWSVVSSYAQIGVNILVQIVLIPLYLSYLGKAQFGILMIVLASINYLGLGVTWASSGAQRIMGELYAHQDVTALRRVLGLSKIIFFLYASAVSVIAFLIVWSISGAWLGDDPALQHDVVLMLAYGIAYVVILYDFNVERLALIAVGRQAVANILSVVSQIVFAVLVVPVLIKGGGLPGVIVANLIGIVIAHVLSSVMLSRFNLSARRPNRSDYGALRRLAGGMGVGYGLYGALLLTLLQADTLLLGVLGGATVVADYVLIWKVADVAMQALWRLPESLVPYLVHMDAKGEKARMHSIFVTARKGMLLLAAVGGLAYGVLGSTVVKLWVGAENAPDAPWAYALAGGALFWMVIARLPAVYAFSVVKLRPLVFVIAAELFAKLVLLWFLFQFVGLYAPLIAINVIHISGVAYFYQRLFSKCGLQDP